MYESQLHLMEKSYIFLKSYSVFSFSKKYAMTGWRVGYIHVPTERLDSLGQSFSYVKLQGAFYVMARYKFTDSPSRDVALRILDEAKVIAVPGGSFGPGGEGHLRLSFGGTEEEINEAFDRIEKWLRKNTCEETLPKNRSALRCSPYMETIRIRS